MKKHIIILPLFLAACISGPNPNPGERTFDMAITYNSHLDEATVNKLKKNAEKGYPWAQLRMGVIYELGNGVKKDLDEAEKWYLLTSQHHGTGGWSNGRLIFVTGTPGYFNQNTDALIAKFQLANMYLNEDSQKMNIEKGYELISEVKEKSKGKDLFYCCEFAGGRWFHYKTILDLFEKAEKLKANE